MLKAAIFDLNGVFIVSPKLSERFEKDFLVPAKAFLPKLGEIMDRVRRPGTEGAFSYWKPALEEWKVNLDEGSFWKYWFEAESASMEMIALAKDLRAKRVKVIVLSNNFKERADYYAQYPWMKDAVDRAYFSWQTGFVKPDPEAWKLILKDFDLKPDECIYFDDQEKNLEAARSVGIEAHMFTTPAAARDLTIV